jgi:arsenate reductase
MSVKKIYYLKTCSTCSRIIKELGGLLDGFEMQDIKSNPIQPAQLDAMKTMSGSFEALFSRKSQKFKEVNQTKSTLTELDFRKLILDEYTFLKRPVFIVGEKIFIGNTKPVVESLHLHLKEKR